MKRVTNVGKTDNLTLYKREFMLEYSNGTFEHVSKFYSDKLFVYPDIYFSGFFTKIESSNIFNEKFIRTDDINVYINSNLVQKITKLPTIPFYFKITKHYDYVFENGKSKNWLGFNRIPDKTEHYYIVQYNNKQLSYTAMELTGKNLFELLEDFKNVE